MDAMLANHTKGQYMIISRALKIYLVIYIWGAVCQEITRYLYLHISSGIYKSPFVLIYTDGDIINIYGDIINVDGKYRHIYINTYGDILNVDGDT